MLREITPPLRGLLSAYVPGGGRLETVRPLITLKLKIARVVLVQRTVTATLTAFAKLALFSRRLDGHSETKKNTFRRASSRRASG